METWNHRVIKSVNEFGELYYQIHEVYYNKAGQMTMHTERAIAPCGENLDELKEELVEMLHCLKKPVLDADKIVFGKPDFDYENAKKYSLEEVRKKLGLDEPDDDNPELTRDDFKNLRPFLEVFPALWKFEFIPYRVVNNVIKFRPRKKHIRPVKPSKSKFRRLY